MFDRAVRLYEPQEYPLSGLLSQFQIVSPFLADHDARKNGNIRYKVYTESSQNTRTVSSFIRNKGFSGDFEGTWMVVAEWSDVPMFPAQDNLNAVSIIFHLLESFERKICLL